jgi:hypothetical protein
MHTQEGINLPVRGQEHVAMSTTGRRLSIVESDNLTGIRIVDKHEAAAPDPGAYGIRRGDRKLNRDRGVGGVTAATENLATDLGRLKLGRGHDAALERGTGSGLMDCSAANHQADQHCEAQGREQPAHGHRFPSLRKP